MKKLLLIPLLALFTCVNAWGELSNVCQVGDVVYKSGASADNASAHEYRYIYSAFNAALNDVADKGTIVLLKSIGATSSSKYITISKNVTIDGGGYSLSRYIVVNANKTLTLKDITVSNTYKASSTPRTIALGAGSTLKLSGATIVPGTDNIAVGTTTAKASATINLVSGTNNIIRGHSGKDVIYFAATSSSYSFTITGEGALSLEQKGTAGYAFDKASGSGKYEIHAQNLTATAETAGHVFYTTNLTSANITAGVYSDKPAAGLVNEQCLIFPMTGEDKGKYQIIGTINVGTYGVKASIDKLAYTSLAAAIEAAEVGDEIKLWADAEAIEVTKSIYIYPNGRDGSAITAGSGYARATKTQEYYPYADYYFFGAVNSTIEGGKTVYLPANSSELAFAASVAADGETIRVAKDITLNEKVEFVGDITFDLNGKTITCSGNNYLSVQDEVVTFVDGIAGQTGTVTTSDYTCLYISKRGATSKAIINGGKFISTKATDSNPNIEKATISVAEGADLEINSGRVQSNNNAIFAKSSKGWKYSEYVGWTADNTVIWPANVTINGGEIVSAGEEAICMGGCSVQGGEAWPATLTLTAGTIAGSKHGVVLLGNGATINMTAGTIAATNGFGIAGNGKVGTADENTVNNPGAWVDYGGTAITISGGSVTSTNAAGIYQPQAGTLTISGGAITGKTGIAMKSGELTMTAGTITANGEKALFEKGWNGGALQTGAAISIESNSVYAGEMEISITGSANLISAEGYAIYEYVDAPGNSTHVNAIAVANDSTAYKLDNTQPVLVPKFKGGISISQSLGAKGGFVSGGTWSVDVLSNCVKGKVTNPITSGVDYEAGYRFNVGEPTPETAIIESTENKNAVLTNNESTATANAHIAEEADLTPENTDVKTTTASNSAVVSENTDVVANNSDAEHPEYAIVEVKKVTVEGNAELNIKEGATLMVGTGSITLDTTATTGGLTVEAGAALVVDGLVYGSTEDNFVIEGQEDKSGIVLFSPETEFVKEDHPTATYRFTSKSFYDFDNARWIFQRFGMPSHDGNITMRNTHESATGYVYAWNGNDWGDYSVLAANGGELTYKGAGKAVPFQCYQMTTTNVKADPVKIEFVVELMGNADAPLNFKAGWNPYANSYTAPIDIKEFLTDVIAANGSDILATIYLYKDLGNDTYTWQGINLGNVGKTYRVRENGAMVKKTYDASIEPMQAFIMKLSHGEDATTDINYLNNIYNPAMGIARPAAVPARNRQTMNEMQIGVYNDLYWDNISLMEAEQFSADMDNGYDAVKYDNNHNGVSLYVMNGETRMERIASNDIDGTMIGINAPAAGEYTLDFSGVNGEEFVVIDMKNGTITNIVEDGEYTFYTEAGQNDYRFQVVNRAKMPTAVENTEAGNTNVKGIYTITGQFMGYDFNSVPAGVYVVNGIKVIK